jgi:hypothetical protein
MSFLEAFSSLAPFVQLALIVGTFATVFLVACNRTAATNLITFLRDLYSIRLYKDRSNQQLPHHPYDQQWNYSQQRTGADKGQEKWIAPDELVELNLPFEAQNGVLSMAGREKDTIGQPIEAEVE